jgi:pyruvate-formate lyase-activating enzyme
MQIGILTTSRCNAACSHCSTSCGPQRTESLSRDKIVSLIDEAAALNEDEAFKISLSGGEPFLEFELLADVVARAHRHGAEVTVVTNGYWATSHEKACSLLTRLKIAGLTHFAVSTSPFHQQFVKRKRVERVLNAAREVGIPCRVKYVRTASDPQSEDAVLQWALAAGAESVQELPLMPHLREGAEQPESEYSRVNQVPQGTCPAPLLTVAETGTAYTCCTPGGFAPFLALGNTHDDPFADVHERFYLGAVQQVLRKHGPAFFAQAIAERGESSRLRRSYSGVCDLCTHIASDLRLAEIAQSAAEEVEVKQLQHMLEEL